MFVLGCQSRPTHRPSRSATDQSPKLWDFGGVDAIPLRIRLCRAVVSGSCANAYAGIVEKVEETSQDNFDWVVLLECLVLSFGVKSLGPTLVGYIYSNSGVLYVVNLMKAFLGVCSDLIFKVKTHDMTLSG